MCMKSIKILLVVVAMFSFAACSQPENTGQSAASADAADPAAEEAAVAAAVDSLNKGILDPEQALLENIASEYLSYGHSGGKIQNKAEFVDDLLNGPFDFETVETADQVISLAGDNAIVRHTFISKASNAGEPVDIKIGNLLVWKKKDGQWKLLARQAFRLPQ